MKHVENEGYLNNICLEFQLLNNFLDDLNSNLNNNSNENYTSLYDKCVDNIYNIQYISRLNSQKRNSVATINNGSNNKKFLKERVDEKYIEHNVQNLVFTIKNFLRNNYSLIDDIIEKLKNRNKKLMEKLKQGVENAENQENYIEELEKKLQIETEKNRNVSRLVDKINHLTKENEKLININEILEHNALKQKEENKKMAIEIKKYTKLYEQSKDYANKYRYSNILNNEMNVLFKEIKSGINSNKKYEINGKHFRSYSFDFLSVIEKISSPNYMNRNREKYYTRDYLKYSYQKKSSENNKNCKKNVKNNFNKNTRVLGGKIGMHEYHNYYETCKKEKINKILNDKTDETKSVHSIYDSEEDIGKNYCNNENEETLSKHTDCSCSSSCMTKENDNSHDYNETPNKQLFNTFQKKCTKKKASTEMLSKTLNRDKNAKENAVRIINKNYCTTTTLLMDIRKTLRHNRTDLINSVMKNRKNIFTVDTENVLENVCESAFMIVVRQGKSEK